MAGPLTGFRILDLSRVLSGPAATMLLADQGADVIKVEPLEGDVTRQIGFIQGDLSSAFLCSNRGKRSVALNLKTPGGLEVLRKLASTADVFVQNFRPGAIEKLRLSYTEVSAIQPRIVYLSMSGFGESGPYAHKRVYDPVIQALSGITDIQADAAEGRPRMIRTVIPDKTTALTAAQAITAGLLARERSGHGQHIKLSMLDATIAYLWPEGMSALTMVGNEHNVRAGQLAQDLVYQTNDGYITAGAVSNDEWAGLCTALERPEWKTDPRFATTAARFKNGPERLAETAKVLATRSSAEWLARLDAHNVPCAPILSRAETIKHAQVINNALLHEYDHPDFGRVRQPRAAARFTDMPLAPAPRAPHLGEHNAEVLSELGYSVADVQALMEQGVVTRA
jgi:crotonobetainyl-CoA:carnitine CoA-transferase CaiB-like acyl-CoA transferase